MPDYTTNEILEMLSKIDDTAIDITESAENDKKNINADYEREKEKFDAELSERYKGMADEADKKNEADMNARIEQIDKDSKEAMDNLDARYESEKDRLAEEIFERITEV